jgi:hypothetical protein
MNNVILNIGLNASKNIEGSEYLKPHHVLFALQVFFSRDAVRFLRLDQSSTEPTLVVYLTVDYGLAKLKSVVYHLSENLRQDAIAGMIDREDTCKSDGFLVGPHANLWGEFNEAYFIV